MYNIEVQTDMAPEPDPIFAFSFTEGRAVESGYILKQYRRKISPVQLHQL